MSSGSCAKQAGRVCKSATVSPSSSLGLKPLLSETNLTATQQTAREFIVNTPNCAVWMGMGSGKTGSSLTAISDLIGSFDVRRALVIAPLRVARRVWKQEVAEWAHLNGLTVSTIVGTATQRLTALRTPADVYTINMENIQWLEAQFIQGGKQTVRWPWEIVFLDESQGFRSQSSQRWKSLRKLRRLFPRMVQLTGTPAPNGYAGLWSQLYLLDQGKRLGATEEAYRARFFDPPANEYAKWTLRTGAKKEIHKAISDIVISFKSPDKPIDKNWIKVQLSAPAMATYKKMASTYIAEVQGKVLTAVNAGVLDSKLLQLANGIVYHGVGDDRQSVPFHDEKVNALAETIDGLEKAMVVYSFSHDLERIKGVFAKSGRSWAVLNSDASFDRWASGELDFGVLHPRSCGHGLNDIYKSGVKDMIHYGMGPDLELYTQVNARLAGGHRRAGGKVMIHHIVAEGTRDMDYVKILKDKGASQDDLMASLTRLIK